MNATNRQRAISWAKGVAADAATVFLDTEIGGLGPDAEIVDVAIIGIDGRVILDTLVLPLSPIPAEATAIHGITVAMCERAKAPMWRELWPRVATILHPGRCICVYNADYDFKIIQQVTVAAKLPEFAPGWQCAMKAYADFAGVIEPRRMSSWSAETRFKWFKLGDACELEGIVLDGAHRALADAEACRRLVLAMAAAEAVPEQAGLPLGDLSSDEVGNPRRAAIAERWRD